MGFKKKTVFVVGAGAHVDYGMPTGPQLIAQLGKWRYREANPNGDVVPSVTAALRLVCWPREEGILHKWDHSCDEEVVAGSYHEFKYRVEGLYDVLSGSPHESIDSLLSQLPEEDQKFGKLIISALLIRAEEQALRVPYLAGWHRWLANRCQPSGAPRVKDNAWRFENVDVITFNYDRLFEFHMQTLVMNYDRIVREYSHVPDPHHVYGKLDTTCDFDSIKRRYVSHPCPDAVKKSGRRIRIADGRQSVQIVDSPSARALHGAKQLVFLGFAFDELNLERIGLHVGRCRVSLDTLSNDVKIFATAFEEDVDRARRARNALGDREIIWGKTGHGCVECLKSWGLE